MARFPLRARDSKNGRLVGGIKWGPHKFILRTLMDLGSATLILEYIPCIDTMMERPKLPGPFRPPRRCPLRSSANTPQDDLYGCSTRIEASLSSLTDPPFFVTIP